MEVIDKNHFKEQLKNIILIAQNRCIANKGTEIETVNKLTIKYVSTFLEWLDGEKVYEVSIDDE